MALRSYRTDFPDWPTKSPSTASPTDPRRTPYARHLGCTLLTANVVDFDFLQQVRPEGRVLFYGTVEH